MCTQVRDPRRIWISYNPGSHGIMKVQSKPNGSAMTPSRQDRGLAVGGIATGSTVSPLR